MKRISAKGAFLLAIFSTGAALVGAFDLLGHPARTVHILTIFAGGFGAGVSLARAIERIRAGRRERVGEPPVVSR